jgi:hypothetical protein
MGLNDEYSRDAYNYEQAYDSDDSDEFDPELHPEDWQDMYSQELLDGWMKIREYTEARYIANRATFNIFVHFVINPRNWYTTKQPHPTHADLWDLVRSAPIVGERLTPENFYAWAKNYIDKE